MPIPSPPVIGPNDEKIAERTEELAEELLMSKDVKPTPSWDRREGDLGRALIHVFAKMACHAVERINRVPDRSFLAFLDRIGVTPAGARAAQVPLTFSLVARGEAEPTVPAGTCVGAAALPGDTREIVFATERDLRTTRAKLAAVFVRQPDGDCLADHTAEATGASAAFFDAFDSKARSLHALYLAADAVLGLPAGIDVTVDLTVDEATKWQELHVIWEHWNGARWVTLSATPAAPSSLSFKFKIPESMVATTVHGRKALWIRGRLPACPAAGVPELSGVKIRATEQQTSIPPDAALSNGRAVDLSLDFYPFGEQPKLNDMLLLACDRVLARPGATVTVNIELNENTRPLSSEDKPVLTWEISTGSGWEVMKSGVTPQSPPTNDVLRTMAFNVPAGVAPTTIGGKKAIWLRIRLSGGWFGRGYLGIDYNYDPPQLIDDGYRPPIVKSITLSYTPIVTSPLCTIENDLVLEDRTFQDPFLPFMSTDEQLYLAADDVLGLPAETEVAVDLSVADFATSQEPSMIWEYSNGTTWAQLVVTGSAPATFSFPIPLDMAALTVHGRRARWIRGRLLAWPAAGAPELDGATIRATQPVTPIAADAALSNGRAVDLSLDFHPFGEQPRLNDTLLLACDRVLARPGTEVTVNVTLSTHTQALKETDAPVLTWAISTGSGWHFLFTTTPSAPTANDVLPLSTKLKVPPGVAPAKIGGKQAVWLRIRLSGGSFGTGVSVNDNTTPPSISDDGYRPPIIQSITFSFTPATASPLCTTEKQGVLVDHTFQAPFAPFTLTDDTEPELYLGFDRCFTSRDTSLFFQVAPLSPVSVAREVSAAAGDGVSWEYWSSVENARWTRLVCEDETRGFARSGQLAFVAPAALGHRVLFGKDLFWLRARYTAPAAQSGALPPVSPRLGRVLTNTVWARAAISQTNEMLGSADGSKGQSFTLTARPVLDGQRIEVREARASAAADRAAIVDAEGEDAISDEVDPRYPDEVWVRWHEVPNFHASESRDRCYVLDREAGVVRFGDGRHGMAAPQGTRNVRAAAYSAGGGADGNRPVHSVEQLKTTVPYVDSVTNHEAATGGADADTLDDVKTWGPRILRHGHRAVTAQDFEDLALAASPAVARARAITPGFDMFKAASDPQNAKIAGTPEPGNLVLLLVTNGPEMPPAATTGLLRDVDAYLRARSAAAVSLKLAGPTWVKVSVTALEVRAKSASGMEALRDRIERVLAGFFHPLTGNVDGAGWAFGALPHDSDVYRLVMSIPGVDRIGALTWTMRTPDDGAAPSAEDPGRARALIYPGHQTVQVLPPGGT